MNVIRKLRVTADTSADRKLLKRLRAEGLIDFTYINLENAKLNVANGTKGWVGNNYPAIFTLDVSALDGTDILSPPDARDLSLKLVNVLGGKRQNLGDRRQLLGHYYSGNHIFVTGDKGDILNNREYLTRIGIIVVSNDELEHYVRSSQ